MQETKKQEQVFYRKPVMCTIKWYMQIVLQLY